MRVNNMCIHTHIHTFFHTCLGSSNVTWHTYKQTYIHTYIHTFFQTCWSSSNGTCVAAPRFTEVTPWGTTPGLDLGSESGAAVLPAIYNHRMARINLTAYAFGGMDGKKCVLCMYACACARMHIYLVCQPPCVYVCMYLCICIHRYIIQRNNKKTEVFLSHITASLSRLNTLIVLNLIYMHTYIHYTIN